MIREYDEIELGQLVGATIGVIHRNWKIVLFLVVISGLLAAAISLLVTPIYKITAIVEPGIIGRDDKGQLVVNDTAPNLAQQVNNGSMDMVVIRKLKLNPLDYAGAPIFRARVLGEPEKTPKTEFRSIEISCTGPDRKLGEKMLATLIECIEQRKKPFVDTLRASLDTQIAAKMAEVGKVESDQMEVTHQIEMQLTEIKEVQREIKQKELEAMQQDSTTTKFRAMIEQKQHDILQMGNEIKAKEEEKKRYEAENKLIGEQIDAILADLKAAKKNADNIEKSRLDSIPSAAEDAGKSLSFLLFDTVAQQNITYSQDLATKIHDLKMLREDNKTSAAVSTMQIASLREDIEKTKIEHSKIIAADAAGSDLKKDMIRLWKEESLPNKISEINIQIAMLKNKRDGQLAMEKRKLEQEAAELKIQKEQVYPIWVLQTPEASIKPVFPKKKAMVGGAMIMVFIASVAFVAAREVIRRYMPRADDKSKVLLMAASDK